MSLTFMSLIAAVVLFGGWGVARADVPKAEDIATCNNEAQEATRKGKDSRAATPYTKDHSRAADARRGVSPSCASCGPFLSPPEHEGMGPYYPHAPPDHAAYSAYMLHSTLCAC